MKSDYELSDFLIESPYELIDEDRLAIRRAIGSGVPHKDQWSKSCLEVFKEHVKEYYDDVQNGRLRVQAEAHGRHERNSTCGSSLLSYAHRQGKAR